MKKQPQSQQVLLLKKMSPLCLYELDQLVKWPAVPGHVTLSPDMWASRSEGPASFAASSAGITPFLASIVALFFLFSSFFALSFLSLVFRLRRALQEITTQLTTTGEKRPHSAKKKKTNKKNFPEQVKTNDE